MHVCVCMYVCGVCTCRGVVCVHVCVCGVCAYRVWCVYVSVHVCVWMACASVHLNSSCIINLDCWGPDVEHDYNKSVNSPNNSAKLKFPSMTLSLLQVSHNQGTLDNIHSKPVAEALLCCEKKRSLQKNGFNFL